MFLSMVLWNIALKCSGQMAEAVGEWLFEGLRAGDVLDA